MDDCIHKRGRVHVKAAIGMGFFSKFIYVSFLTGEMRYFEVVWPSIA